VDAGWNHPSPCVGLAEKLNCLIATEPLTERLFYYALAKSCLLFEKPILHAPMKAFLSKQTKKNPA
jgi:hypothetical protein